MKRNAGLWRVLALSAALLGGTVGAASAAYSLDCADWISSSGDDPALGYLTGTETRTTGFHLNLGIITIDFGTSYEVGYYEMDDGEMIAVDCRTYTEVMI